ncbi:MAG: hypothetical protein QM484_10685 [Woeseiaceae bacterium]
MKTIYLPFLALCLIIEANTVCAENKASTEIVLNSYITSESFSNILPIKQLIKDKWQTPPTDSASNAFTQNEIGVSAKWQGFTLNLAHRLDYFIYTNADTAQAFYLDRSKGFFSQKKYLIDLKLQHQASDGIRLGYEWQSNSFFSAIQVGYWTIQTSRKSQISGELSGFSSATNKNNISGNLQLKEFYSDFNVLRRPNNNSWNTKGFGATVDIFLAWQLNKQLKLSVAIKDFYSTFKIKGIGYSEGTFDTENSYINSLGGQAFLPLYRGVETVKNQTFSLPTKTNFIVHYQAETLNYLFRYKRQGRINFYAIGGELTLLDSSLLVMVDIERLTPEIQMKKHNFALTFAIDNININQARQFNLGFNFNCRF